MSIYFIIGIVFTALFLFIRMNRMRILKWLLGLRARLQIQSLRTAIYGADKDKEETQRKNMVVFNSVSGKFEPVTKQLLKNAERVGKRRSNAKQTEYRRKYTKSKKKILLQSVNEIEKKSLYVTK